jgi:hypothetical protein
MKQVITAILLKLRKVYPVKAKILTSLLEEFDPNWESNESWVKKTGLLNNKVEELFSRLGVDDREELLIQLLKKLYPEAATGKHPSKRVWLCNLEGHKFFFDVEANEVVMPFPNEEPRVIPAGVLVENLPKLKEFLDYLGTYSMRQRKKFFY